jgi:hypothetical protein
MASPYAENHFSALGIEPLLAGSLKAAFTAFIREFQVMGWRLRIEISRKGMLEAIIFAPDGVEATRRLPIAPRAADRLRFRLAEQYAAWAVRHAQKQVVDSRSAACQLQGRCLSQEDLPARFRNYSPWKPNV